MIRQMSDIQRGLRAGSSAPLMQGVVAKLTLTDMIDVTAYVGSLDP
jgi:cytochrome c553